MSEEAFSRLIYTTLDMLGFQRKSVAFRSKSSDYFSHLATLREARQGSTYSRVCAGSGSEGVRLACSDTDSMIVLGDTLCVDKACAQREFNIVEMDNSSLSPGYTKIVSMYLEEGTENFIWLKSSYMYTNLTGCSYISSAVFRNIVNQYFETYKRVHHCDGIIYGSVSNHGPAMTLTGQEPTFEQDIVPSIYFFGEEYLNTRKSRTRRNTWPSAGLVQEIASMEGYIVPVGDKFSDSQNLEWRICYTTAETKLISTLDGVQIKLYVLLKLIGKAVLKPVCKDITSYILKNVVFWIVETEPENSFSPELLLKLVQKSLLFLKNCLQNNHCPNYMIPGRNLMFGVFGHYRMRVISHLSDFLNDGEALILRIPKLRDYMYCSSTPLERTVYKEWRNEAEKVLLTLMMQLSEYYDGRVVLNQTYRNNLFWKILCDDSYINTFFKYISLMVPE